MNYRIVDNADEMKLEDIVRLLRMTYWADKRPEETIEKSVRNSDCYGIYTDTTDKLVGFARVISDHATAYYLCDVIIDPEYRGNGLGKALVSHIVSRPEYANQHGFLFTRDAHGLYEQYGFQVAVGRSMERR
ncbi:MAG: GNAT family N-acetyltransferase [Clostridia bacterium]|nr:GNAT family N-acetyltransferase [Clostridia bacterium]